MSHLDHEQLLALFAGDGDADAALEAHVFECDDCAARYVKIGALCEALRTVVPPVISAAYRDRMLAEGVRIRETPVEPDVYTDAVFSHDVDFLVHELRGDFSRAERIDVSITAPDGTPQTTMEHVPFTPGSVLIACQRHYAHTMPGDPFFVVTVTEGGRTRTASYRVRHTISV